MARIVETATGREALTFDDVLLVPGASDVLPGPPGPFEGDRPSLIPALRDALLAAKVCAYAEGFAVMAAAGKAYGWTLDFGRIASIWRGGCLLRARFLRRVRLPLTRRSR